MKINIFDVEHGNCALVITPTNKTILIDCGHNDTTGFRPSNYLCNVLGLNHFSNRLTKFIVSNVDQDHLSDLPNVRLKTAPEILVRNQQIDRPFLTSVKEEMTEAFEHYLDMHETYIYPESPDNWGGLILSNFCHNRPTFTDTNNLSIVSFLEYGNFKIVFSGDLEKAGWLEFLKNPVFVNHLKTTKVFVASHHGRESGYCPEVFNFCKPEIVIISDEQIQYDTQKDIGYTNFTSGRMFVDGRLRKVLTTRNNGMITLEPDLLNYGIHIEKG